MILRPIKTTAGRKATFNAQATGTELVLTHMSLGDKTGTMDPALTTLRNERERVVCFGKRISLDQIHLDSLFDGPAEFWPREVGIWAGTTLVYYWSGAGTELGYKSASSDWLIGIDLTLDPNADGPINITASAPNWALTVMPHIATILMSLADTNRTLLSQRFAAAKAEERISLLDKLLAKLDTGLQGTVSWIQQALDTQSKANAGFLAHQTAANAHDLGAHMATILKAQNDTSRLLLNQRFALDDVSKAVQVLQTPEPDPHPQYWNDMRGQVAIAAKFAQWGIDGAVQTLEVGTGKAFATIQAAYESLIGKSIKTSVLIKVADGTYNTAGIFLQNHPDADKIRIEGNTAAPGNCVINFVPDAGKCSHGLIVRKARGLQLAGFRLVGTANAVNWTHRCLRLDQGAQVAVDAGTLLIEGGFHGVELEDMSLLWADRLSIKGCADWHLCAGSGSTASISGVKVDGNNKDAIVQVPGYVNPDLPKCSPSGILSNDGSRIWAGESDVRRVYHAFWAQNAGYLWCDCSVVDDVYYGMIGKTSGIVWSHWWDVTPARPVAKRTVVTNARTIAFLADQGGRIYAPGARAEACSNGFYAAASGFIQASSSWTVNCSRAYYGESMGLIEAWDTRGKTSGCPTVYSPAAHATLGNDNGMVRYT